LSSSEKSVAKAKAGSARRAVVFLYELDDDEEEEEDEEEEDDCDWEFLLSRRLLLDLMGAVNVFVAAL